MNVTFAFWRWDLLDRKRLLFKLFIQIYLFLLNLNK
jgi:hypothetical protein